MSPVIIELAGEPRGKGRPRFIRKTGIAFTPAATRKHEAALRYAAQQEMNGRPPFEGALAITLIATFGIPLSWSNRKRAAALAGTVHHLKAPDADNLLKCCDALNGVAWRDDKQVVRVTIIKQYGDRPRLRIEISGVAP